MCSSLTHLQSAVLAENGEGGLFVNLLVQVWGSWNSFRVPWEGNMTEMSCFVPLAKEKLHPEGEVKVVGLFAYLLAAAERKLCLVFQNLSLCLPGYGKRRTREETAHHILAEKLMLIPDFSIPLGCSQSCFLEDCNCSLPAGVRGIFFSSLPHLCCMLFTTD